MVLLKLWLAYSDHLVSVVSFDRRQVFCFEHQFEQAPRQYHADNAKETHNGDVVEKRIVQISLITGAKP